MMDINMEIEMRGVAAFKEGDDDRIYLDDFDTFLERREVYYIYQAIPPIQADGGRKVYGKDYANTKDIPTRPSVIVVNQHYITPSPPEVEQSMAKHRGEDIVRKKKGGGVPCEEGHCHKKFGTKFSMRRHLEADTKIKCEHCEIDLKGSRNLMSHMKRKHDKFLKKLGCEMCDRVFPSEKSLGNHMKMHNPNYGMFECENCKQFFTQKQSMERHKKMIHKISK
jgi:hypothetical protein